MHKYLGMLYYFEYMYISHNSIIQKLICLLKFVIVEENDDSWITPRNLNDRIRFLMLFFSQIFINNILCILNNNEYEFFLILVLMVSTYGKCNWFL